MEVYILDSLLRRTAVIDKFQSFIWTERFSAYGDFELVVHATTENRNLLTATTQLAINESYRVMTIETVNDVIDSEGVSLLTITGRSLEQILEDRVAKDVLADDLETDFKWIITGTPGYIAREIFKRICIDGSINLGDKIPFITPGTIFPADTILESAVSITMEIEIDNVYTVIKNICDTHELGFRLVRNLDTSKLYFNVYSGNDRTNSVFFSQDLDTLSNVSEMTSVAQYKNVAYVFSPDGFEIVYAPGVNPSVSGFERRVLLVKADDVSEADDIPAALIQQGQKALSECRSLLALDGEINQSSTYKYPTDYDLGDLIVMRNSNGITNNMRVTEQIFVSDTEGERSYPTLAMYLFITPGSWISWDYTKNWADITDYWADL